MNTIKPGHYTSNAELGELIKTWQHVRGRMAPGRLGRLIEILNKIASGVWDKWEFIPSKEDFVQEAQVVFFAKALRSIDPKLNCFSYLTTCAVNLGNKMRTTEIRDRRTERSYGQEYIDRQNAAAERADDDSDDPPEAPPCDPPPPSSPPSSSSPPPPRKTSTRADQPHKRARGPRATSPKNSTSETPAD